MGRVAHDAHDAKEKQHPRPQYAERTAMLFLHSNVGNVGKRCFCPEKTQVFRGPRRARDAHDSGAATADSAAGTLIGRPLTGVPD